MKLAFYKYQGTGNDFVLIDNRLKSFDTSNTKRIQHICDRKFGVGADGFICLENDKNFDFKMVYFNADGNESSMCGNGGRCIVAFAKYLNIIENNAHFMAIDGPHNASINNNIISLQMQNVTDILVTDMHVFLNTGSPHHVSYQNNIHLLDVKLNGSNIRNGTPYFKEGSNVNFVEQIDSNTFKVRTYERGVEDETLSCGTGVTAVAIASHKINKTNSSVINLQTEGGNLKVSFKVKDNVYTDVFLEGPAVLVFQGEISI
jgi:diaminopimelate epimerase